MKAIINTEVWLDPTDEEAHASNGTLVLACLPALTTVSSVWQTGSMTPSEVLAVSLASTHSPNSAERKFNQCLEACQNRCNDIHAVVAQALLERAKEA